MLLLRQASSVYSEKRKKKVTKGDKVDHIIIESRHIMSLRGDLVSMMVEGGQRRKWGKLEDEILELLKI